MKYRFFIDKPARKFILKQSKEQQKRILEALYRLPKEGNITPMRGRENLFRLRIGEYRAIYSVQNEIMTVSVMKVGPRGDVYK